MSCHTRSKNERKFYLEIKGHLKTEAYEEKKSSKAKAILKIAHYNGNRKFTLDHYYNSAVKEFFQLKEAGPVYALTEAQEINSFENGPIEIGVCTYGQVLEVCRS